MADKNIHALLIEDDPDDVLLLKESLVELGPARFKLDCVDRLSRGLLQLGSQNYDVLLLDLNLPDSRGLDTLTTTVKRFPRLPVVVLSGLADDAITVEAVRRGAQDYLVKGEISGPLVLRVVRYAIERKQVEAVIRASETRYRTLVETSPNGITLADLEGKLLLCNQQAAGLYGYNSPDSVLGNNFFKFVSPTDRQHAAHNIRKTLNEGKATTGEYLLMSRDGKQFPAEISTAVQCNTSGAPVGFISIIRDVTERKKVINAEKQVVMLEKDFLSGIAQDFRTPLQSIMEYFIRAHSAQVNNRLLQDGSLERASKDLAGLLDMVNELLDFSLLESDQLILNREKVNLVKLIGEVVANYREQASARRVAIVAAPADALFAEVDAARMRRVFASLVKQAIGNSEKDTSVLVTGKSMNGSVLVNVIDEGQGIPFEDCERIFEKYYQMQERVDQGVTGMSMGLHIARQIVEAHGGTLKLSSQVKGGNTFSVTIPVEQPKTPL
jgi:PAS domain S-box-containing protein